METNHERWGAAIKSGCEEMKATIRAVEAAINPFSSELEETFEKQSHEVLSHIDRRTESSGSNSSRKLKKRG
jgi:hypothetical protein